MKLNFGFATVQEDTRTKDAVKRIRKQFDEEADRILAQSLSNHAIDCADPGLCAKKECFVHEPDKIVGEPYIVVRNKRR